MFKEQELILAQSAAKLAICEWDVESGEIRWLSGSLPLFGCPPEELTTGWHVFDCIVPEDRHVLQEALEKTHNGDRYSVEFRVRYPNGEIHWIYSHGQLATHAERKIVIGVNWDITERRVSEERLRAQARLLELAFEPIFARDAGDRIVYWNQGAERLYGYSCREAKGQRSHDLLCTKAPEPWDSIFAHMAEKGYWEGELIHCTKNGRMIHVASRWQRLPQLDGSPYAVLETNFDLSHRRDLEIAKLWQQKAKLIGELAHEINNPLEAATGAALLLKRECGGKTAEQYAAILEESIKRIAEFIRKSNELHQIEMENIPHHIQ